MSEKEMTPEQLVAEQEYLAWLAEVRRQG